MYIFPAIDIIDGKLVRLTKGRFDLQTDYEIDILEQVRKFKKQGLKKLHLVDLDGAKNGKPENLKILKEIALKTKLQVDFGGGIKTEKNLTDTLKSGANQINIGSLAFKESKKFIQWMQKYGSEKFILSCDAKIIETENKQIHKNEKSYLKSFNIFINGWETDTGINLHDGIKLFTQSGLKYITCTDIDKDGTLEGPNIELYKALKTCFPQLKIIASGGISKIEDLKELSKIGIYGAITGKAIYEGKIKIQELKNKI